MRFSISSLLTLAAAATAVVAQPSKRGLSLNPPTTVLHEVKWEELPPAPIAPVTNAKRFAQGLPPLRPKRRNPHGGVVHARQGTRVATAPRSETSSLPPTPNTCNILVKNMSTGQELGYVSKNWNKFAEYGALEEHQNDNALQVSFSASPDIPTEHLDLITVNGLSAAYPYFGATVGFSSDSDDISEESINYLILTGNTQTPAGSVPSYDASNSFSEASSLPAASESAIWSYDPITREFTAQWVNSDGSSIKPHIFLSNENNQPMFTLIGSVTLFQEVFGNSAPEVAFTCVPPVTVV